MPTRPLHLLETATLKRMIYAKDQLETEAYMQLLVVDGVSADDVEAMFTRLVEHAPHDVHGWWKGPCDVCPSPN